MSILTEEVAYNHFSTARGQVSSKGLTSNQGAGSFETLKEIVDHLKEDVINKQI
jgi:hypothetical protein